MGPGCVVGHSQVAGVVRIEHIVLLLPSDCPPCVPSVAQESSNPCLGNESDPIYKYTDDELKPRICQICPYNCDAIPEEVHCLCASIGCTKRFIAWKTCRATAG
ncbi:hypothetical protein AAVH_12279 [Aphelenchoides avenae]|nr:hypothetical protein AAVH_12279 [Aphelenchus avenae]